MGWRLGLIRCDTVYRIEAELAAFPQQAARAVEARRRVKKCEEYVTIV